MKSDNELIQLIRNDKRKSANPVHISIDIGTDTLGEPHEILSTDKFDVPTPFYTIDESAIVAQLKIATKLTEFATVIHNVATKYCRDLDSIYGKLFSEFRKKYGSAYMSNPPKLFEMRQLMEHVKALAKEIALCEDKDESIFDAKRIENELSGLSEE